MMGPLHRKHPPVVAGAPSQPLAQIQGVGVTSGIAVVLFVAFGLTLLRLGHQRWLGWILIVLGPLATLTILGAGASMPVLFMLVLGLALAIHPYPSQRAGNAEVQSLERQ